MKIEVLEEQILAPHAAAVVAVALRDAVASRGRATVAFSGGSTAGPLLAALSETSVPWEAVDVLQVDERIAPEGHSDRNLTTLQEHLVARVPALAGRVHPMPVDDTDLDATARYARTVRDLAGTPPRLDLVHLGIGTDGHTASLFPDGPLLDDRADPVGITGPYEGRRRMTLTLPVLSRAREVLWLVRGASKAPVVRRLAAGDTSIPAGRVDPTHARLLVDRAAAAELTSERTPEDTPSPEGSWRCP